MDSWLEEYQEDRVSGFPDDPADGFAWWSDDETDDGSMDNLYDEEPDDEPEQTDEDRDDITQMWAWFGYMTELLDN